MKSPNIGAKPPIIILLGENILAIKKKIPNENPIIHNSLAFIFVSPR